MSLQVNNLITQVDNGRQKLDTLSATLSMNVEERCQCGFSVINILEPRFRCFTESEDAVTFRAEIIGTGEASPADIATYIQNWITQGALVTFDFVLIVVDNSCQVVVTSILDPECNPLTTSSPPIDGQAELTLLGGALSGLLLLIIVVLVISLLVCCWIHKKRSGKLEISRNRYIPI